MNIGQRFLFATATALGIASTFEVRASVFALLLLVIALAALSRVPDDFRPKMRLVLLVALGCAVVGTGRFVFREALPGIAEARGRASGKKAVSLLREILFAQDAMRRYAEIDPDGDGVGSAGTLAELSGSSPARGSSPLSSPPLALRYAPRIATRTGPATEQDGHFLIICLPGKNGGWVTHPGDAVDEELAERRWVAYAWPAQEDLGHSAAYFIDEHERILVSQNAAEAGRRTPASGSPEGSTSDLRLVGSAQAPSCSDALAPETRKLWQPWKDKKARQGLPGER